MIQVYNIDLPFLDYDVVICKTTGISLYLELIL